MFKINTKDTRTTTIKLFAKIVNHKLNAHKTFRRCQGRFNALCSFNLRFCPRGKIFKIEDLDANFGTLCDGVVTIRLNGNADFRGKSRIFWYLGVE